jgi:hypothetical protein
VHQVHLRVGFTLTGGHQWVYVAHSSHRAPQLSLSLPAESAPAISALPASSSSASSGVYLVSACQELTILPIYTLRIVSKQDSLIILGLSLSRRVWRMRAVRGQFVTPHFVSARSVDSDFSASHPSTTLCRQLFLGRAQEQVIGSWGAVSALCSTRQAIGQSFRQLSPRRARSLL